MTLEINTIILGGNLTRDVAMKDTPSGRRVCTFTVANNRTYLSNNQKITETSFIDVDVWGKMGDNCSQYLRKGSPVVVTGRLKQERWATPDGGKRSRFKVVAQNVQFLSFGKRPQEQAGAQPAQQGSSWE